MQCTNCQFQNMPGTDACGRCGTSLRLATAVIDVHPPRAGRVAKRVRRAVPVRRMFYGVRDAADAAGATPAAIQFASVFPLGLFARLVVPGWSHFYLGLRWRGHLFLWLFLAVLLPGLLLLGTLTGGVLIGLAFGVHSTAALDVVTRTFTDASIRDRVARSALVSMLLAVMLYLPVAWAISYVAAPRIIAMMQPPFAADDVVLVNHLASPDPGDVVVYSIPPYETTGGRRVNNVIYTQDRIDRVLAGPGDQVTWADGKLSVNGAPSDLLPLMPTLVTRRLEATVPDRHVLILPSTTPNIRLVENAGVWQHMSMVPIESISGQVWARSSPLSRFWLLP
jgi:signal peptidase I